MSNYLTSDYKYINIMSRNLTKGGKIMNIKQIRLSRNLTQKELADKLAVERTTVTMWERNSSSPNIQTLKKIAEVLDCTVDDLIKEKG